MSSRTISVPDIASESPLYEQSKKWLAENGIDENRVPLESVIVVTDESITYERIVLDENGVPVIGNGQYIQRESVTIPKLSAPETFGL
ncbi:hypothetical protein PBI_JUDY_15 [Arthrobacter phage Judy]|uniref:Uncharacterized protein n=1 Tax=Arthrobacter phage Judy TaxID=2419958 RepID=A0A3G2KGJ3_9CAUD|nr:hypothetical protein HOU50_gp15 [Arthrobacter phage Judy]AYN58085.1 hypothetical protein PBI_JUDY_15 [Arthrobacter phage Judy]